MPISNHTASLTSLGELFIEAAQPNIYQINAFRLLELPVDCGEMDVSRRQKVIEIAQKTGVPPLPGPGRALPLDRTLDKYGIGEAVQRLRDPERRFIDEFFWFWPHELGDGKNDEALTALRQDQVEEAVEIWSNYANNYSADNVSIHNLAVRSHLMALDLEMKILEDRSLSESQLRNLDIYWRQTFRRWSNLLNHDAFWSRLTARVREFDDPRLDGSTVQSMRAMLPMGLLMINVRLAIQAYERGDEAVVERQLRTIQLAEFPPEVVSDALQRALGPMRERIKTYCKNAESQAEADPVRGNQVARGLLEQCQPLLQIIDRLLPETATIRQVLHDEIALRGLSCLVSYGNTTENWQEALGLMEQYLAIAASPSARSRLQDNVSTLKGNLESGNDWCGEGYFDLPPHILEPMEKARQHHKSSDYEHSIPILEGLLTTASPPLDSHQLKLVHKALSTALNQRSNDLLRVASLELDRPRRIFMKIKSRLDSADKFLYMTISAVLGGTEQMAAQMGQLVCMACGAHVTRWITFSHENSKFLICPNCNAEDDHEMEGRKSNFGKALIEISRDLMRAQELDPNNQIVRGNLEATRKIAKDLNLSLPARWDAGTTSQKPVKTSQPVPSPAVGSPSAAARTKSAPRAPGQPASNWRAIGVSILIITISFIPLILLRANLESSFATNPQLGAFIMGTVICLPANLAYLITRRSTAATLTDFFTQSTAVASNPFFILSPFILGVTFWLFRKSKLTLGILVLVNLITYGINLFFLSFSSPNILIIENTFVFLAAPLLGTILAYGIGKLFKFVT
ncbi:MAG: hypothetical protein JXB15_01450 [Anaerolineales bacterium]|nr:hypothetical protein [Anaerolineales bacterium]